MKNFDTTDDGFPTASHRWEQQFLVGGRLQMPTVEKLRERIRQLSVSLFAVPGHKAAGGWSEEMAWRRKQLETLGVKEDPDVGDTQPAG